MANIVIAITGENANGILECQSDGFPALLRERGLHGRHLRLGSPDIATELKSALQGADLADRLAASHLEQHATGYNYEAAA